MPDAATEGCATNTSGDCAVSDEPLYAAYLAMTGLDHPGRDVFSDAALAAHQETRALAPERVVQGSRQLR